MSEKKKLRPYFDPLSTIKHNLNVLRRKDPFIKRIIHTAAQVSLYELNVETTVWSRMNVEGPLFLVQRDAEPLFQFIVMNRLSPDYLVEHLYDFEFELHNPYILYRNASQEVNGIWFYYSDDCDAIARLLNDILDKDTKASMEENVPSDNSKFEELLKTLTSLTENPGESFSANPPGPDATKLPVFVDLSSTSKVTGNHAEDLRQPCHSAIVTSTIASGSLSPAPAVQMPSVSHSASSTPAFLHVCSDAMNGGNHQVTDLVKPLHLFPAAAPSSLLVPPIPPFWPPSAALPHSPSPSRLFPPATPLLPVSPISASTSNRPVISREKVRDALLSLAKDDQFIDMIYQALEKP